MSNLLALCLICLSTGSAFVYTIYDYPYSFVAAVVDAQDSLVVATGAVISVHWVLTSAHLLEKDDLGIDPKRYDIFVGEPLKKYSPKYALTHPCYTWGLYTAEDFALFYVELKIELHPILLPAGRFPWDYTDCEFIYWPKIKAQNLSRGHIHSIKREVTLVQNCFTRKEKRPVGVLEFYLDNLLCGTGIDLPECVGSTGGLLYCQNILAGLLIRHTWCETRTANFTDLGVFAHWLNSRTEGTNFLKLQISDSARPRAEGYISQITITILVLLVVTHNSKNF